MAKIEIKTNYIPHPGQKRLHDSNTRFKICAMGRRWGKTLACVYEILQVAVNNPHKVCLWVAPVYQQTKIAWRFMSDIPSPVIKRKSVQDMEIELMNGSLIKFGSTEKWENLKGIGIDHLVIDEAAMIKRDAWEEALRPALADKKGRAIFISTPKGKNWFYELFTRGNDPSLPQYESFTFPTSNNPYIDPAEIEYARLTIPDRAFRQEFLAEFLDDGAGVFRNIKGCFKGDSLGSPNVDWPYVMGADIAKHQDFTVITVLDKNRHVVDFVRFNKIDWPFQKQRIAEFAKKWNNAKVILDATGVGDVVYDDLSRAGLNISPYKFTNESKKVLIEGLAVDMEQNRISYPDCPEIQVMVGELEIFGYEVTRSGNVRYNAPEGYHDDCVISLALANWGSRSARTYTAEDLSQYAY